MFFYYDPIQRLPSGGSDLWSNKAEITKRLTKFKAEATAKAEATRV
jgi:hypothetical protein